MIINIRGTNGSGKSTLVREYMSRRQCEPILNERGKAIAYRCYAALSNEVSYVIGRYETACGGCDTIKTQQEAKDLVAEFSAKGDVLFEGVLISTIFGPWLEFSRKHGGMLWAFLDTPLEECLRRIQVRNGGKPVKEDQVKGKWETMRNVSSKALAAGEDVVWLDHRAALGGLSAAITSRRLSKVA